MADYNVGDAVVPTVTEDELRGIFQGAGFPVAGFDAGVPVVGGGIRLESHESPVYGHGHVHYSTRIRYLSDLLGAPVETEALVNAIAVDTDGTLCFRATNGKRYYIDPDSVKDVTGSEDLTTLQYAIYGGTLNEVYIEADVSYVYQQVAEARRRKNDDL